MHSLLLVLYYVSVTDLLDCVWYISNHCEDFVRFLFTHLCTLPDKLATDPCTWPEYKWSQWDCVRAASGLESGSKAIGPDSVITYSGFKAT